jgi:hypothetical protein
LEGYQNSHDDKKNFSHGISQIPGDPVLGKELLADMAEEFDHWHFIYSNKFVILMITYFPQIQK